MANYLEIMILLLYKQGDRITKVIQSNEFTEKNNADEAVVMQYVVSFK